MSGTEQAERARPRAGDELELTIDRLAHGGAGVARLDGYVVFVRGGVPGDRVRARVTKSKRSFAEADSVELLAPGPDRIEPLAPHPGAPWQVLAYERQLAEKQDQARDALERIGGFEHPPVEPIAPALERLHYRNKLEYSFGEDERGELVLGFHRAGRWDLIDPVERDILASERVDRLRAAVGDWCRAEGLSAWDRRDQNGLLRNLVAREGRRAGVLQARLVTSPGSSLRVDELAAACPADSFLWTRAEGVAETTRSGETEIVRGSAYVEEELGGLRLRISPDAFFQTNTEMAELLYRQAADLAGLSGREKVLDLFCGIGTIALLMALDAGEVWGVEIVESAVADAIENARLNGIDNASFFAGDVRLAMRPLLEKSGRPDVVVVDPPRAGLSQKIVRRVLEAEAHRIVYVSCNPTTLAPNARQIVDAGYELRTVRPVDMFPQTPHIECVALLEKRG
ncbi:MAG TPA: 23S rRNA (uracil(1939)-C(5))-methyltransferase RlmD [Thermoleophilaceae bacterium]|nr:23S rRNA (uracil(1939)-C(5))-methyltransferase RlmD [Thermoleophilaceae bacterium]